jgi:hypothetical protein
VPDCDRVELESRILNDPPPSACRWLPTKTGVAILSLRKA